MHGRPKHSVHRFKLSSEVLFIGAGHGFQADVSFSLEGFPISASPIPTLDV